MQPLLNLLWPRLAAAEGGRRKPRLAAGLLAGLERGRASLRYAASGRGAGGRRNLVEGSVADADPAVADHIAPVVVAGLAVDVAVVVAGVVVAAETVAMAMSAAEPASQRANRQPADESAGEGGVLAILGRGGSSGKRASQNCGSQGGARVFLNKVVIVSSCFSCVSGVRDGAPL